MSGPRRTAVAWLLAISSPALAGCLADDEHGQTDRPVVSGTPSADEAVVAIAPRRTTCEAVPAIVCSGTLIAPRVVLTAAHCLASLGQFAQVEVFFGADVAAPGTLVVAMASAGHPAFDPATNDFDAALLLLAEPAPVAAHELPTDTIEAAGAGATLRAVGFGVTDRELGDTGVRLQGTLELAEVRAGSFDAVPAPAMTCVGDSGGPVFATIGAAEQLVGVTARGDFACELTAFNQRVDVLLADFVASFIDAADGAAIGWPADRPAIDELAGVTCATSDDCPALMSCLPGLGGEPSRCGYAWLGPGTFGDACAAAADCDDADSQCVRLWPDGADQCRCFTSSVAPPPDEGCCAAGPGGRSGSTALLIAIAFLLSTVRRRASPQR